MFEDSTFESTGKIRPRNRRWMAAAFVVNASILAALVLIPLLDPEALPRMGMVLLLSVPSAPAPEPKPFVKPAQAVIVTSTLATAGLTAPTRIPRTTFMPSQPEVFAPLNLASLDASNGATPGGDNIFTNTTKRPVVVHPEEKKPVRVSSMVVEGLAIQKTTPTYPPIARAAGVEGTVVLQATISRRGTIENLRAVSGPALLQQAALDAVHNWRYRPYLLNGEPVEVETTINVIFKLH